MTPADAANLLMPYGQIVFRRGLPGMVSPATLKALVDNGRDPARYMVYEPSAEEVEGVAAMWGDRPLPEYPPIEMNVEDEERAAEEIRNKLREMGYSVEDE